MLFGAHVSAAGGLLPAIERADDAGAEVIQVHTQSPRVWRPNDYSPELLAEFAARVEAHSRVRSTICHASYLINLASSNPVVHEKSRTCLETNLVVATQMGAIGLVLHPGSHLGVGFESVLAHLAGELTGALDRAANRLDGAPCRLLLENTAGAGGTIGRDFAEIAALIEAAEGDLRLGVCLDTQHLFASGVRFDTLAAADAVVEQLAAVVGLERLGCLHLNDSKVPFGANRDRHENLGEGYIGRRGLGSLLSHPALQGLPTVLEVPGRFREGPGAEDLQTARRIHAAGLRRRRDRVRRAAAAASAPPAAQVAATSRAAAARARVPTRPPRRAPRPATGGRGDSRRDR